MPRYLLLQCVAALGLGLCGLFYAAVSLALAAVVVVLAALAMLSVWVVRLLLKCHEQLERLKILKRPGIDETTLQLARVFNAHVYLRCQNIFCLDKYSKYQCGHAVPGAAAPSSAPVLSQTPYWYSSLSWFPPAPDALLPLQRRRTQRARTTAIRAAEFAAWLKGCAPHRAALLLLAHACTALAIACLLYVNLVYGVVFDERTGCGWLLTCFFAMLVEGIVQQPLVLMVTAVLGDFVEQGSNVLLDVLIGNN
ncbi:hypothetical protein JKP88DRAFT_296446 [Tribonema minus]|uniref:Uncharacterized protein n=1 Tax=Tribonema minus TaxID=303371 RepID=A0A835ZE00_9STRA|nr:hypothetical protein JKP88DRAFT_296446 [Tribonema minus]